MSKPIASARIPHSWNEQIREIAQETGRTPSDVVKEAIGKYLGKTMPDGCVSTNRRLSKVEHQLARLQRMLLAENDTRAI
ncbi:MAG: hypothetical protein AAGA83_17870 [Cyanobacteria bacterium P01_F01_bin.116]